MRILVEHVCADRALEQFKHFHTAYVFMLLLLSRKQS